MLLAYSFRKNDQTKKTLEASGVSGIIVVECSPNTRPRSRLSGAADGLVAPQ